jgi:Ca-activated chloride channel family protein
MRNFKISHLLLIFLSSIFFSLQAQTIDVTGKVSDEYGEVVIGAIVTVKGNPSYATSTDFDGFYKMNVNANDTLIFKYLFLEEQIIAVNNTKEINVILYYKPDVEIEAVTVSYMYGVSANKSKISYNKVSNIVSLNSNYNNERYGLITENTFLQVAKEPLSTFSVDVDAASYTNVRRFIQFGQLPPIDAVRIEEMINYFEYDYPSAEDSVPFSVSSELSVCPWNQENLLLHIGLQGKEVSNKNLPASNLVFLVDVSGSMGQDNKLPLLKESLNLLIKELREEDKISIVTYAGSIEVILASASGNEKNKIKEKINNLGAGGMTNGGDGLILAYELAEKNFIKDGNNRIILATDGDFNFGLSSNSEMEKLVTENREKGVAISVLGFGDGNIQDDKMEIIANKGNGNYYFIDNLNEAHRVLVKEFSSTLFTIAKDVKFQLEFNPAFVAEYRLLGYENRLLENEDFEDDKKDAGEIGAGHSVTALYELILNSGDTLKSNLKYQNKNLSQAALNNNELVYLKLNYKKPDSDTSNLVQYIVKNEVKALNETSNNYRLSAAVAAFGMLLRNSVFKGNITWESTYQLAKNAIGNDNSTYKKELLDLIQKAEKLSKKQENTEEE